MEKARKNSEITKEKMRNVNRNEIQSMINIILW